MDGEDLSLILLEYYMLDEFELEPSGLSSMLVMYEEALEIGLKFLLSLFVLEVLHVYEISL